MYYFLYTCIYVHYKLRKWSVFARDCTWFLMSGMLASDVLCCLVWLFIQARFVQLKSRVVLVLAAYVGIQVV